MELSKKTTILLAPDMHERLSRLAARRQVSLGELIRQACVAQYGLLPLEDRLAAVDQLASLALPVAEPAEMKRQSVPSAEEPLP